MAGQSLAAYHPEKALMQGTVSPCPCKASFPSPLLLFLLITAAIFQSNGHASAILFPGSCMSRLQRPERPRSSTLPAAPGKKQEPNRIYLAAGICGNMPPRRLKQLKFSPLITACSWLP